MANIFWPEVDDLWSAKKACIQASSVAFLVGAATGVMTFMHSRGTTILEGINGANYIDAAVFLTLSFFIYGCSRTAALAGFVLYVYGQAMLLQQTHRMPVAGIIFSIFFISGIRGAFAFHEAKKGLSASEVKTMMKEQRESAEPNPSMTQRIIAWVVLIVLAGGGYWWYRSASRPSDSHIIIRDTTPAPTSSGASSPSIPVAPKPTPPAPADVPKQKDAQQIPVEGLKTFQMKDGSRVSGKIVLDDPVYYALEDASGKQTIVIKEDITD